jgi:hypothetical protein
MPPSTLRRILRLHRSNVRLRDDEHRTWASVAAAEGYADQAHLARDAPPVPKVLPMVSWGEVMTAVGFTLEGDKEKGRAELLRVWEATGQDDHAQRCVLAHYLADLEIDLDEEVRWDELALAAYPHIGDSELTPFGIPTARGLAPSLHLNLGDGYLRQGQVADATAQLSAGLASLNALPEDGYGAFIRSGLLRLQSRLEALSPTTSHG